MAERNEKQINNRRIKKKPHKLIEQFIMSLQIA